MRTVVETDSVKPSGSSAIRTAVNLLIIGAGARMTWIAGAFVRCGWLLGFSLMATIGTMSAYMVYCLYSAYIHVTVTQGKSITPSFCALVDAVLGRWWSQFGWICLNSTMIGFQAATIVTASDLFLEVFPAVATHKVSCAILGTLTLLLTQVKDTTRLSYFSLTGLVGSIGLAGCIVAVCSNRISREGIAETSYSVPSDDLWVAFAHFVMAFNMALAVVPLLGGMKDKHRFPLAAGSTLAGLGCLYAFISTLLYLAWGNQIMKAKTAMHLIVEEGPVFKTLTGLSVVIFSLAQYTGGFYAQGVSLDTITSNFYGRIINRLLLHSLHVGIAFIFCSNLRSIVDPIAEIFVPLLAVLIPAAVRIRLCLNLKKYFEVGFLVLLGAGAIVFSAMNLVALF